MKDIDGVAVRPLDWDCTAPPSPCSKCGHVFRDNIKIPGTEQWTCALCAPTQILYTPGYLGRTAEKRAMAIAWFEKHAPAMGPTEAGDKVFRDFQPRPLKKHRGRGSGRGKNVG